MQTSARPIAPAFKLVEIAACPKLGTYNVGTQLLQFQGQRTDTDGRSQIFCFLVHLPCR